MSIGVSSLRPLQDPNAMPTDLSSLSGEHGQQSALSGG
jgi:hypothetical protein